MPVDLTLFYAAVAAVATGDIGEAEIIHQTNPADGLFTSTTVLVRREVRTLEVLP